jgi:hypothetical protein
MFGFAGYLYRHGLVYVRGYWSCNLLTGLPVLQTHRPGLACSRDYWSCSPQPLTDLPILQTHGLVLLLKELLVLQLSLTGLPILQTHGLAVCSAQQQNPQKVGHGGMASDVSRVLVTGVFADYLFCRLGIAMLYLDEAFSFV